MKLLDDGFGVLPPVSLYKSQQFPVIYGQNIYFLSSLSSRNRFMETPLKYISQPSPRPSIPITVSIVGPPKSGKSTGSYCIV